MTVIAEHVAGERKGRVLSIVALCSALLLLPGQVAAQGSGAYFIPGDAKAGMHIFFDKGCARCHAILGEGGRSAPDLARAPSGHLSAAELVAAMWNHAPAMWEKMRVERVAPPKFTESDMANLFAFLYSVRSFDEPGDPQRGRQLLQEKRCLACHAVGGQGGRAGPDLKSWASYRNPVSWVQAMWNHAPAMQKMMAARGLNWPEFHGSDVADLIVYVRTLLPNPQARVYLRPASPEAGRQLFQTKGCVACHSVRGAGGRRAPDLGARELPRTLGQFAGVMWNHAPAMWASMKLGEVARPQFSNKEMADLISFLFAERYFEAAGNAERGRRLFEEKGCAGCHGPSGEGRVGPDLSRLRGSPSPIRISTTLWNHGPIMFERMKELGVSWPRFRAGEMVDLMEFLGRAQRRQTSSRGKE